MCLCVLLLHDELPWWVHKNQKCHLNCSKWYSNYITIIGVSVSYFNLLLQSHIHRALTYQNEILTTIPSPYIFDHLSIFMIHAIISILKVNKQTVLLDNIFSSFIQYLVVLIIYINILLSSGFWFKAQLRSETIVSWLTSLYSSILFMVDQSIKCFKQSI